MRSPHQAKPKSFAMNMTPMIDIVFLLIIFFIVSSSMIKQEGSMKLDLPIAQSGEQNQPDDSAKATINVDETNQIFLGTRPVTQDELQAELSKQKSESTRPLSVRIRTSRQVPYAVIEPILLACARSGIGNVSFAVVEE